jgi:hypothetical protein
VLLIIIIQVTGLSTKHRFHLMEPAMSYMINHYRLEQLKSFEEKYWGAATLGDADSMCKGARQGGDPDSTDEDLRADLESVSGLFIFYFLMCLIAIAIHLRKRWFSSSSQGKGFRKLNCIGRCKRRAGKKGNSKTS